MTKLGVLVLCFLYYMDNSFEQDLIKSIFSLWILNRVELGLFLDFGF
jgi:hypothetical protein